MGDGPAGGESNDVETVVLTKSEEQEGRLYRRVVYVRVTETEWDSIRRRAQSGDLSMSRFLVRAALTRKPLLTREERAQSEERLYRMRRTAIRLRQLAGLQWMQRTDPETVEMLRETAGLLEQLVQEMTRRLYGSGR